MRGRGQLEGEFASPTLERYVTYTWGPINIKLRVWRVVIPVCAIWKEVESWRWLTPTCTHTEMLPWKDKAHMMPIFLVFSCGIFFFQLIIWPSCFGACKPFNPTSTRTGIRIRGSVEWKHLPKYLRQSTNSIDIPVPRSYTSSDGKHSAWIVFICYYA